ncbi:hypothetical protein [Larkinella soli]|uniref:hypothetical protein n=1 Tax=Larkinella soli TaxID=1770527 RepID=UPI000FFC4288|nr:hypothetical protein [Larkinella soli]
MDRRTFLCKGTAALLVVPALKSHGFAARPPKPAWLLELIRLNDQQIGQLKAYRVTDPNHPAYGGLKDGDDIPTPQASADYVRRIACAVASPESTFYRSKELLQEAGLATRYLLKIQHSDGTVDLLSTNFHSTPDTGFIVKRLAPAYRLLSRTGTPEAEKVMADLKTFLLKAGEALSVGGIHTPNHRWVVSAALARLQELWPNPRYVARIDEWLAEKIDIDADGQYNERSTLIYSPLTNRLLITIARALKRPELLEPVRKNLSMMLYYVHPNGEVVSEASGRQDKALVGTMEGYFYPYRYMAIHDQDGAMAAQARMIEQTLLPRTVGFLDYLLDDTSVWQELPAAKPLPVNYVREFPHSGLTRVRRDRWDSTLLSANPVFMTFHKGEAVLQGIRVAASFFGKGQFQADQVVRNGDAWVMTRSLEGPYYQPFGIGSIPGPGDGDWEKMPREQRKQSEVQTMQTTVTLRETGSGMEARIQITGTERVPVALELIFRPGGTFAGVTKHPSRDNAWLLSGESGSFTSGKDTITFGPGLALHRGVVLRGALPPMDAPTVYLTGFTPFDHTIRLS